MPLLVDAAQSLGWGPVEGGWSLLAASAHKWGGPAGRRAARGAQGGRGSRLKGPRTSGSRGGRPGFENIPAIVAAAASLRAVRAEAAAEAARLRALVDRIRARVPELVPDVEVVGDPVRRLPHLVTFSCLYVDGEALLHELDRAGFSVSSGSSCTQQHADAEPCAAGDGRAVGGQRPGLAAARAPTEADVERFLDGAAGRGARRCASSSARPVAGGAAARAGDGRRPLVVDALGKRCPIPVIELAKVIGDVPVGGTVTVLSDDEAARLDIPAWCEMRGQEYVGERRRRAATGAPRPTWSRAGRAGASRPAACTVPSGRCVADLGGGVVAVRLGEAVHEVAAAQLVLLGADRLDDQGREHAADLGGALQADAPGQAGRGSPRGRRRRRRSGRPWPPPPAQPTSIGSSPVALDADALRAERGDPGADLGEDLLVGPAGLGLDQRPSRTRW